MAYLVEVPVEAGGRLLVQACAEDLPDGLELAARPRIGEIVARASEPLEDGIVLGAETGVVVAKGTSEVHFTVTLTSKSEEQQGTPADSGAAGADPAPAPAQP